MRRNTHAWGERGVSSRSDSARRKSRWYGLREYQKCVRRAAAPARNAPATRRCDVRRCERELHCRFEFHWPYLRSYATPSDASGEDATAQKRALKRAFAVNTASAKAGSFADSI